MKAPAPPTLSSILLLAALWAAVSPEFVGAAEPPATEPVAAEPVAAEPETEGDGTTRSQWTLPNGLRVMVHDVPQSRAVAVAVGYGFGSDHDPEGREGIAALLAEVRFTAAAGDIPARTKRDLESIRPLGWDLKISPRAVFLSEIGTTEQFPGMLRETAVRMRGVRVTDATLKSSIVEVRRNLSERYSNRADMVLHFGVRLAATRNGFEAIQRYASGAGLDKISVVEVQKRLDSLCTTTRAVLSITGDVSGFDIRRLVENTFADVPAGPPAPPPAVVPLRSTDLALHTNQLAEPAAVLGILAPSLEDTAYAGFALHALAFGTVCQRLWEEPVPPISTRFQYQILDEPDLVRMFPPVTTGTNMDHLSEEFRLALSLLGPDAIKPEHLDQARAAMAWVVGGELPVVDRRRAVSEPRFLNRIAVAGAARGLIADEAFWAGFRERLARATADLERWRVHFIVPANQVRFIAGPR